MCLFFVPFPKLQIWRAESQMRFRRRTRDCRPCPRWRRNSCCPCTSWCSKQASNVSKKLWPNHLYFSKFIRIPANIWLGCHSPECPTSGSCISFQNSEGLRLHPASWTWLRSWVWDRMPLRRQPWDVRQRRSRRRSPRPGLERPDPWQISSEPHCQSQKSKRKVWKTKVWKKRFWMSFCLRSQRRSDEIMILLKAANFDLQKLTKLETNFAIKSSVIGTQ